LRKKFPNRFGGIFAKLVQAASQPRCFESEQDFINQMEIAHQCSMDEIIEVLSMKLERKLELQDFIMWFPLDEEQSQWDDGIPQLYGCDPATVLKTENYFPTIKPRRLENGLSVIGCLKHPRVRTSIVGKGKYEVEITKKLQVGQKGLVEDYLRQVDELYGGKKMIRKGLTQHEVKSLLLQRCQNFDMLPVDMKMKIERFFSVDNTKEEWEKNRGLLEYLFDVNIVFVKDVEIYNSKLVSLDVKSNSSDVYVYLKIYPTVIEVYMKDSKHEKDSIFIPNLFSA
jgi:hypothetical protein